MLRRTSLLVGSALVMLVVPAAAEQNYIATERSLLEVIQSGRAKEAEAEGQAPEGENREEEKKPEGEGQAPSEGGGEQGESSKKRSWAILPQIGLSPEKGAKGGVKFTNRDFTPFHLTLDLAGSAAQKKQRHLDAILISPSFGTDWLMMMVEGEYYFDPTKEFFGLGNNDVGPDELSTNEHQRVYGTLAMGLRLSRRFALVASGAYNEVQIHRGDLEDSTPSTVDRFPNLPGIRGGRSNPLSFAVLFNDRESLVRPTRGWSIIAKASWVPRNLGNDFEYTRYILDGSYLYPLLTRRQVLGLHLGGQYIDAKARHVPFYEFAALGGSQDLRGFFEDRFLGESNVMINGEYRLKIFDFNFFDIWQIRIDGVAFGDVGRVFIDEEDIEREVNGDPTPPVLPVVPAPPTEPIPPTDHDFRYSYGGGARIALGEALVARLDIGFSEEEKGLIYLVFGHTF